jgi:hypothetical protein
MKRHIAQRVAMATVFRIVLAFVTQPAFAEESAQAATAHSVQTSSVLTFAAIQVAPNAPKLQFFFACPDDLDIECRWIAENVGDVAPLNSLLAKLTLHTRGPLCGTSYSRPSAGWPVGLYRLELRHKGEVIHVQRYIVDEEHSDSSPSEGR